MQSHTLKYFEEDIRIIEQQLYEAKQHFKKLVYEKVTSKGMMYYSGFVGTIEENLDDNGDVYGKIVGIPDLVTYEASSDKDIQESFESTVDDYIETLEELENWSILDNGSVI